MHFRVSIRRKGDHVYRYGQLVQSYRRDDGTPAHRVIASLGRLTEQQADNLRAAFQANRQGNTLVLAEQAAQAIGHKCGDNFLYLPIAVAMALWRSLGLGEMLDRLTPKANTEVPLAAVIAALVLQRCIDPDSKLASVPWFATTALPELLGVHPRRFNNTRVHRAMELLELIEAPLQAEVTRRVTKTNAPFRVLYLDCSDTWFVGAGPELARKRGTKDGRCKRRVGIVLLCDGQGHPLRWATVPGDFGESPTMMAVARAIASEPWAQQVPFVMDRAMGNAATLEALSETGLRFLTAVPRHEFATWSPRIPLGAFDSVPLNGDNDVVVNALTATAKRLGFLPIEGDRFALDLGVVDHGAGGAGSARFASSEGASRAQVTLRLALRLRAALDSGAVRSATAFGRELGVSKQQISTWHKLCGLVPGLRERVWAGDADRLPLGQLTKIADLPEANQVKAFDEACAAAGAGAALRPIRRLARLADLQPLRARAVVTFHPELFLRQRRYAQQRLDELDATIADLNRRLRSPSSRRDRDSVLAEVGAHLRRHKLQGVFEIRVDAVESGSRSAHQVTLERDEAQWRSRRAPDGVNLMVAHPDHVGSATDMVALYFGKDMIEKDFRTIKSGLALRPVHHRTDPKLRAHVTLCVLALLLERTLEARLRQAGLGISAPKALRTLSTCFLNHFANAPIYTTTTPKPDQLAILEALGLQDLVNDQAVAAVIHPR